VRRLRKLYDVDGVLADFIGGLCKGSGGLYRHITPEKVTSYDFEDCLPFAVVEDWRHQMLMDGFALSLPVYPQAREQVQTYLDSGYDVVYVTKPYRPSRTWAYDRLEWLDKYMPKAPVVMTGHKHLIKGDILVEDHPGNLAEWLDHHPTGMGVLVDRPWNQSVGKLEQYPNWHRSVS
jgi:5'(3')-deoxyribonucleotidase